MGEEAAGLRQLDLHRVVAAQADVVAEVGVAGAQVAEDEDRDDQEGDVLETGGEGDHQEVPSVPDAVTDGSGRGSADPDF